MCLIWHQSEIRAIEDALTNPDTTLFVVGSNDICPVNIATMPNVQEIISREYAPITYEGPPGPKAYIRKEGI